MVEFGEEFAKDDNEEEDNKDDKADNKLIEDTKADDKDTDKEKVRRQKGTPGKGSRCRWYGRGAVITMMNVGY